MSQAGIEVTWEHCKIVEENEDGKLVVLEDNVKNILKQVGKEYGGKGDTAIVILSVGGSRGTGKSVLTNILMKYLESSKSWSTEISEKGPTGFNYHGGTFEKNWCVPGNQKSGVYIAPKMYKLDHSSGMKLAIIMHLYQGSTLEGSQKESSQLNKILCMMSTSMAEMSNGGETNLGDIIEDLAKSPLVQEILCKNVVRVNRKITNGTSDSANGMKKFFLEEVLPLCNNVENSQAKYSSAQLRKLQNIFIALLDPVGLRDNNKTIGEFPDQLKKVVEVLNSVDNKTCSEPLEEMELKCSTGKTMAKDKLRSPETVTEKVPQPKSVEDETKAAPAVLSIRTENISTVVPQETKIQNTDKPVSREVKIDFDKVYGNSPVIWKQLQSSLESWMEKHLSYQTVDQIPGLFGKFVDEILKQKCADLKSSEKNINGKTLADFTKLAKDKISKDYLPRFQVVLKAILKFRQEMENSLSTIDQHNPIEFNQQLNKIVKSVISSCKDDSVKTLIDLGCTKMYPYYHNWLQNREAERNRKLENVGSHLARFYQDEMKKVTESDKYFPPDSLRAAHTCLVEKIEELWALTYTVPAPRNTTSALTNQLNSEFTEFEKKNLNKIAIAQKNADKLLSKMKSAYEIQMDEFLQENADGVDDATFEAAHKNSHADVFKQFQCDAEKILRKGESIYPHLVMLKSLLDYSQSLFKKENASLREQAEEKKKVERGEEKSQYSMKEDQFQYENNTTGLVLEPMLFQFGLVNYGVATVTNCDIDTKSRPAVIAWTGDNEWIVGEEVGEIEAELDGGALQRQWTLAEMFTAADDNSNEIFRNTIDIGTDRIKVTPEFILGMFLKLEKQRIEKNYNGFIEAVYISVPFWLPSYQRQQVLDAASIAGFKESFLFSENTAAAYFTFASALFQPKENTVVISESSNKLDIAIFSYQQNQWKMSMIGHAGDYESDMSKMKDENGWVKYIPLLGQIAWLWKYGSSKVKGEEEKLVDQLASLYSRARKLAERARYADTSYKLNILITCESSSWTDLLVQVAKKIPGYQDIHVYHPAVLHGLNALLKLQSRTGSSVYEYVSDGMPYYVKVQHDYSWTVVDRKAEFFSKIWKRQLSCRISSTTKRLSILQENSSGRNPVLHVTLNKQLQSGSDVEIHLKRNRSGIISLTEIKYKSPGMSYIQWYKMEKEYYNTTSDNLTLTDVKECTQTVDKIMSMSGVAAKLEKGRDSVRAKVKSILNSINDGKGTIPSDIVKMLVTNQVKAISHSVEQTEFTLDDVNASLTVLENLATKYML